MRAPDRIETARLLLTPPRAGDAGAIFSIYASDPEVTRYLSWPTHRSVDESAAFVAFSAALWAESGMGPYLIRTRSGGALIGSTGLAAETPGEAITGYVLARACWGRGYATEALRAMVRVACDLRLRRLIAFCHTEHATSLRVLEKCGFVRDPAWTASTDFPNLEAGGPQSTARYLRRCG